MSTKKLMFLFLIFISIGLSLTVTQQTCSNTTTQLVNTTYENGTQFLIYTPCAHGCINSSCLDSSQQLNYMWLFIGSIAIILIISIFLIYKSEHDLFKTLTFFFGLLLITILLFTIGGFGNQIGETAGNLITYAGYLVGLIFLFLFLIWVFGYVRERFVDTREEQDY